MSVASWCFGSTETSKHSHSQERIKTRKDKKAGVLVTHRDRGDTVPTAHGVYAAWPGLAWVSCSSDVLLGGIERLVWYGYWLYTWGILSIHQPTDSKGHLWLQPIQVLHESRPSSQGIPTRTTPPWNQKRSNEVSVVTKESTKHTNKSPVGSMWWFTFHDHQTHAKASSTRVAQRRADS